ncbi:transposase [Actinomadura algeriensis]|uniref:transposase n=1 Tax=Actinomadura algeriensis TaxID=1679523 RepID=UPI0038509731
MRHRRWGSPRAASTAHRPWPGPSSRLYPRRVHLHAPRGHQQLPDGKIVLVWDNLNIHLSTAMRTFIDEHADWLTVFHLPAYAPELGTARDGVVAAETLHGQPPGHRPGRPRQRNQAPTQGDPAPRHDRRLPGPTGLTLNTTPAITN